jgi:hypothetical protein
MYALLAVIPFLALSFIGGDHRTVVAQVFDAAVPDTIEVADDGTCGGGCIKYKQSLTVKNYGRYGVRMAAEGSSYHSPGGSNPARVTCWRFGSSAPTSCAGGSAEYGVFIAAESTATFWIYAEAPDNTTDHLMWVDVGTDVDIDQTLDIDEPYRDWVDLVLLDS